MGLAAVADRLYGLTPAEFTDARNAEASAARSAGDPGLAAEIRGLRKPSTAAWLVNTLVRRFGGEIDELLAIGAELRSAQRALAGDDLRRLSRERHDLIGALIARLGRLATELGHRLTEAVRREIAATLDAAVVDEAAAVAVRSGRLVRALAAAGFDPVDLAGAVAAPADLPTFDAAGIRARLRTVEPLAEPEPIATAAHRHLDDARSQAALAERALVKADATLSSAASEVDRAAARVRAAEQELGAAQSQLSSAQDRHAAADRARAVAAHTRDAAQRAAHSAEAALGG